MTASLDTLHKTSNSKPLAVVLGLAGGKLGEEAKVGEMNFHVNSDEVCKLGEVFEDKSSLQHKADVVGTGEVNFDKRGNLVYKQFTLSDHSELSESNRGIETEELFSEEASMTGKDSQQELKDNKTNLMDVSRLNEYDSEATKINDPKKREKRERFYCEQCNKILLIFDLEKHMYKIHTAKVKRSEKRRKLVNCNVCNQTVRDGWNLTRHMRSMHSAQGEISCPKDFCDSMFESEYDMKVKNTKSLTL